MPRSRKRHHSRSRSRSRSRSLSLDRNHDRHKRIDSYEKDGKRRRVDDVDSPAHKRSLSSENNTSTEDEVQRIQDVNEQDSNVESNGSANEGAIEFTNSDKKTHEDKIKKENTSEKDSEDAMVSLEAAATSKNNVTINQKSNKEDEKAPVSNSDDVMIVNDSDSSKIEIRDDKKEEPSTPKKPLTPKLLQKRIESEKKKQQRQKEKEEREKQRQEEKAKILAEKEKLRLQKETERQELVKQKQKEKEMKEEQKRKEKEEFEQKRKEKEQKRKEKEEQEVQKRKEKELEKLKKQQEIEEKNKEKQKEDEKKQKIAALFVGFFKKTDSEEKEKKAEKVNSNFMPFEVKSDMRLPSIRRNPLSGEDIKKLDLVLDNQDENASYLRDLKSGAIKVGKAFKTWPYEDPEDEITIVEEDKILGETICDKSTVHKTKTKFLFFHENRRPAYFGTWRKKSKFVKPRKPFGEDAAIFNYGEDSDDDWEDEEQGESLDASADEEDKEGENADDDYEVDNEFFVPHGHLSDDEIDDEENAKLSPESLKQKLKLLKDEFDEDIKSKTHKLKPRSIGCIWYSKKGDNVEDAIQRYLQPFAMIVRGQIEIKKRSMIFVTSPEKKKSKNIQELPPEQIPYFLKIINGNVNRKKLVIQQFLTYMANNGLNVEVSKINLSRFLKQTSTYKKCKENGPMKNKFCWFVNEEINKKYNVNLKLSAKIEN